MKQLFIFFLSSMLFAQYRTSGLQGTITGRVLSAQYKEPVEYANVVLYRAHNQKIVTGTVTDHHGVFVLNQIAPGLYYIEISFMGLTTRRIEDIRITPDQSEIDLSVIYLEEALIEVDSVEVISEHPVISYEIDKKVINVSKQAAAVSGSAVEVLENVPSVSVDIEGNVSLRGSENFTLLIDGRPTVLEPAEALKQIPASSIDNIEIITAPSAKYDPEGIVGIINIILKKESIKGISGFFNCNAGLDDKYGGDLLLNYRRPSINLYLGMDYSKWSFPGTRSSENTTFSDDTMHTTAQGTSAWTRNPYGLRTGIDLHFSSHNKLGIQAQYGRRKMEHTSLLNYREWNESLSLENEYSSSEQSARIFDYYSLSLDYDHTFQKKEHKLMIEGLFHATRSDEESKTELLAPEQGIESGQLSTESGPVHMWRFKADYTLPFSSDSRLECGAQSQLSSAQDSNKSYEYDTLSSQYIFRPEFSYTTDYLRNIHSIYGLYVGRVMEVGYQIGLRTEYTYRLIELVDTNQSYNIDRWDFFPSCHFSYKFYKGQQVMGSYTSRIRRPRSWWLEPFFTWYDAYNVRQGNPALKPEYVDAYELGFQTPLGRQLLSIEGFYRIKKNNIEHITQIYQDNIMLHTFENAGTEYALGLEGMVNLRLFKLWNINAMADFYQARLEDNIYQQHTAEQNYNWNLKMRNELRLLGHIGVQMDIRYRSKATTAQGIRAGFFVIDGALKKEFLNRRLSFTLQVRDILSTGKREFTSQTTEFYNHSYFDHNAPIIMLNISYNFNNYKKEHIQKEQIEGIEEIEEY